MRKSLTLEKIAAEVISLPDDEQLDLIEKIIHRIKKKKWDDKNKKQKIDYSKYMGIYKDLDIDVNKECKEIRSEWKRII